VPSRYAGSESRIGAVIASLGYAVWMPDYPGMGVAPGIQTYCDPGSLARSSLDGFAAARSFLALKIEASGRSGADSSDRLDAAAISARASAGTESGRFYVMGYSEGGLAAMSVARSVEEGSLWSETGESAPPSGLSLAGIYAMGAPLDLSRGFRGDMSADTRLGNPAYTLFVLSGYARAHPDLVDPLRIIRADIRESIVPLLGTDRSAEDINRLIAAMRKKNPKDIVASDVLEKDLLAELRADHLSDPLFRALDGARMDSWNPDPLIPLTLAASRKDRTVPYDHSGEAMRRFSAARNASLAGSASLNGAAGGTGAAGPRLLDLASDSHTKAGVEALLFAVMDLDGAEALLEGSTGRTLPPAFAIIRPER
jgi:alpha-beta hydrolase superfamily lysophospholipase